jgi:ATP-binding cassette subfamily B protein
MNNEITLGQLISFVTLSGYFLGPFSRMLNLQHTLQECLISSERFCEILDIDEEDSDNSSNKTTEKNSLVKIEEFNKPIKIENLSFSYTGRSKVIDDISFEINPGEKVAFVGSSGSGKTTMVKLLMKFYSAQSGNIFINDFSISEIDTKSYRQRIAYVPQDVMLFSGTIAENITLGSEGVTFEEIIEVSKKTKCYDFIQRLPKKFFTYVGEHGASLSGGERQRISLARVLIKNPDVLILDEATASLDSFSESEIMNTVNYELKNITTIIVAHRLSTIVSCDKIFVFDKGKIVERGTHEELILKNGFYKKMWDIQNNLGGKFIEKSDIA